MDKYIKEFKENDSVDGIYYCKTYSILKNKNGNDYGSLTLSDKTGDIEAKIWNLTPKMKNITAPAYVHINATVTMFNGAPQLKIDQMCKAEQGEYDMADYVASSVWDSRQMEAELLRYVESVKDEYLHKLLTYYFCNKTVMNDFMEHSAAKTVHHAFHGGLAEHTLSVAYMCDRAAEHYRYPEKDAKDQAPQVKELLNRDLLITGALLHDIGKIKELTDLPENDYSDEGQLLGHIVIGAQMIADTIAKIPDFPRVTRNQLLHLILSHHGEYEFGSPKKPALMEAFVLSFMDNMDAKLETFKELIDSKAPVNSDGWLGFNKLLDSNVRKTK